MVILAAFDHLLKKYHLKKLFICFWLCWVFIAPLLELSLVAVHGLLIAVASIFAEYRL